MGKPLSPDRVFDFPIDEPKPHPAYDFFAPGPLPGYAGNPNNNNVWIEADFPLLGELGVVADEPMVGPIVDEIAELIIKAEEQVIAPVVDVDEDIAMLFGDHDFEDDDFEGFDEEEVGGPSTAAIEGPSLPYPTSRLPVPPSVSDAEVAAGVIIGEIGPRVFAVEGQIQQLQATVSEMSSRDSTLMQCIFGMDRRLAELERRPPGPQ
ncbi:hypothetical protein Tco_1041608 [Tanacetum coccineum]|uniref:Uncharacterized protein n=1 Tax=Tanacetum coccineum TaxID=301880 RepID=A0ABQ5GHN1_9ASTR